ncbi:hypothetical protein AAG906_004077 [Vitis piasezkii]
MLPLTNMFIRECREEKNGKCSKRSVSWALLPSFLFSYFPPSLKIDFNEPCFRNVKSIYKERCIAVDDGGSWAKYMSISGSPDDEYDIISEECLLTVDENREGQAAAFGDDIATGCLATEFKREIFVVRRHCLWKPTRSMKGQEYYVFIPRSTSLLMAASKQSDPPSSSTSSPPKSHVFPNQDLDRVSTYA